MKPLFSRYLLGSANYPSYRPRWLHWLAGSAAVLTALISSSAPALSTTFPSTTGLKFQTSAPRRCANIGDWYTTDGTGTIPNCGASFGGANTTSTDKIHRFYIDITQGMLDQQGGSITITINDAESNGADDEVDGNLNATSATTSDPTRFRLLSPSGATLATTVVPTNSPNGTAVNFTVTAPGTYQITSETGAKPISSNSTDNLNNDDNTFTITVPDPVNTQNRILISSLQSSFQQDTGANITANFYFLVAPGVSSLFLRNFDLDNGGIVTYIKPNNTTISGTTSGNAVWNGGTNNLNTGGDTISGLTINDTGIWGIRITTYTTNNQTILEGNEGSGKRLAIFDSPPTRAGNFTITPSGTLSTTIGVPVDHPFSVTNNFAINDIINLTTTGTNSNYTVQLLDGAGNDLTDADGDGAKDTGILTPGQTKNFILRVTPNTGATTADTTRINATSFMDKKVDATNNTTLSVDKTTTIPIADVVTTKTGPASAAAGSTVTYNLSTVNNGPSTATNVVVSDNIGTGRSNVVASNGGTYNSSTGVVTFPTLASLANGATTTYTIGFTAPTSGSITDVVSSTSSTTDPTPANNNGTVAASTVTTDITASADVVTTKTGPASAVAGSTVTYNLSTVNNGPTAATNVVVTDNIGTGRTNVVASNSGTYNSTTGDVTFPTLASLANGATTTYTIGFTAPTTGSITDVVSSTSSTTDPTPANNNGTVPASTVTTNITPSADVVTTKTGPASAGAGSTVTYNLSTVNNGPTAATNVVVSDNIGTGRTNVVASNGGTYNSTTGVVTFPALASLANGATTTYTIGFTAPTSGSITDVVSSTSSTTDPTPANNNGTVPASTVTTNITASADVVTTKTGPASAVAGSTVTYNLSTVNNGPSTATNVVVSDNIGTGRTNVVASNGGTYNSTTGVVTFPALASLANGATTTYTIGFTAPTSGSITDVVSSTSSTTDPTPANNNGTAAASTVTTNITASADLSLTKTVNNSNAAVGNSVVYTVTVSNAGPSAATNVKIVDQLPAGLSFTSSTQTQGTYNSGTGIWDVGAIANGGNATLTITATVNSIPVTNTAQVSASDQFDPDSTPGNNSSTEDDQASVSTPNSAARVRLVKRITAINVSPINTVIDPDTTTDPNDNAPNWPANFLRGAIDAGVVRPGDEVEYTIYFLSDGGNAAKNVTICDRVPSNTTFIDNAFNSLKTADNYSGTPGADSGIALAHSSTSLPTQPTAYLSNIGDADTGEFLSAGATPPIDCAGTNTNGAVVVKVVTGTTPLPKATAPGDPFNSYGFIRFRARVK